MEYARSAIYFVVFMCWMLRACFVLWHDGRDRNHRMRKVGSEHNFG